MMASSVIKLLKEKGLFKIRIAALSGCDRNTLTRVVAGPVDPPRRRIMIAWHRGRLRRPRIDSRRYAPPRRRVRSATPAPRNKACIYDICVTDVVPSAVSHHRSAIGQVDISRRKGQLTR